MVSKKQLMRRIYELEDMNRTTSMRAEQMGYRVDQMCLHVTAMEKDIQKMQGLIAEMAHNIAKEKQQDD